jgi:hypothetical protein
LLTPRSTELRAPLKLACRRVCSRPVLVIRCPDCRVFRPTDCPGWIFHEDVLRLALYPCPACWEGADDPITPAELMEVPDAVKELGTELVQRGLTVGQLADSLYPEIIAFQLEHATPWRRRGGGTGRVTWTAAVRIGNKGMVRVERSDLLPDGSVKIRPSKYPPETRVTLVRFAVE